MSGMEIGLLGLVMGLLGMGGGIWLGARGRVAESSCSLRHEGLGKTLLDIKSGIDDVRTCLKDYDAEDKVLHNRITDVTNRISRLEGRLNGNKHYAEE